MSTTNVPESGGLLLPPLLVRDTALKPIEVLFCGKLISLLSTADSLTLTNDELSAVAGRTPVGVSLMLTKLAVRGYLSLDYAYKGRGIGSLRTIRLTTRTIRNLNAAFGPNWPNLLTSPQPL